MRSAVSGHPDCRPIVVVQSPSYNGAAAVVVNTVVAILLLVIAIASSLSSASHRAVASRLPSRPCSASSPPAGCCIASPDPAASHLPGASASHHAVTSRHAPLVPLVQLIVASPLLTPPPPIIPVIVSAIVAIIGGGRESSPSSPLSASSSSSFVVIDQLIVAFAGAVVSSIASSPSRQLPRAFPSSSPSPVAQRCRRRRSRHPSSLYRPRRHHRHHLVSRICVHSRSIVGIGSNHGTAASTMMYGWSACPRM